MSRKRNRLPRRRLPKAAARLTIGDMPSTRVCLAALAAVSVHSAAWACEAVQPEQLFQSLVDRYRGLSEYQDTVRLQHRTVDDGAIVDSAVSASGESQGVTRDGDGGRDLPCPTTEGDTRSTVGIQIMDCLVSGSTLAVRASDLRDAAVRSVVGDACDATDASAAGQLRLASRLWLLPHLSLRFADEPLRQMHGDGDALTPVAVDTVTIGTKELLRLQLTSSRPDEITPDAADGGDIVPPNGSGAHRPARSAKRPSTVHLFVNPESMLIERVEQSREIADGVRYESTIEITPERAVPGHERHAPTSAPRHAEPQRPTGPSPTLDPQPTVG